MSSYDVPAHDPSYSVLVGWDNPEQTYRVQVTQTMPDGLVEPVLVAGFEPNEISSPEELAAVLEPWATIDAAMMQTLREDREIETRQFETPLSMDEMLAGFERPEGVSLAGSADTEWRRPDGVFHSEPEQSIGEVIGQLPPAKAGGL